MWFGTMQNNFDENGNDISINQNIGKLYKVDINKKNNFSRRRFRHS
jgi:sugar lactone lactonase YvrE